MAEIIKHGGDIVGVINNSDNTESTSTSTGSVQLSGGMGILKNIHIGGDLNYGGFKLPDANHLIDTLSTGLFKGGLLSVGSGATFDITAGNGLIVDSHTDPDNPTEVDVSWNAIIGTTVTNLGNLFTHVFITTSGTVLQSIVEPTATLRRDDIYLGKVFHSDGVNTNSVSNQPDVGIDVNGQAHDFYRGLGPVVLTGNRISANGTNLNIDKSAGDFHQSGVGFATLRESPNIINIALDTALTFGLSDRNGIISNTALIVPGSYDNAGTVQAIPGSANRATNQRVYLFNSGFVLVQYGQEYYGSLALAEAAIARETFVVESNAVANGVLIAIISMRSGATDLSDPADAAIFNASKFGEVSIGAAGAQTTDLQAAYNNSTTPEIIVDSTRGALTIIDAASPIGASLLEVQNNSSVSLFDVDISSVNLSVDLVLNGLTPSITSTGASGDFVISSSSASNNVAIRSAVGQSLYLGDTTTTGSITVGAAMTTGDISYGKASSGHQSLFLGTDESTSITTGAVTVAGGVGISKSLFVGIDADIADSLIMSGKGTVTQTGGIATGVTLNTSSGIITGKTPASYGSNTKTDFTVTNSKCLSTSIVLVTLINSGAVNIHCNVSVISAGSFIISVNNDDTVSNFTGLEFQFLII